MSMLTASFLPYTLTFKKDVEFDWTGTITFRPIRREESQVTFFH